MRHSCELARVRRLKAGKAQHAQRTIVAMISATVASMAHES